jgi:peptidoglycan/xylan/chitin deacetylase (PgdA/CDA1 family)
MNQLKARAFRLGLDALYVSGFHRLLQPLACGNGAILMLHRVRPASAPEEFAPNSYLEVSVEFLDEVIRIVKESGRDIVSLDEVPERLLDTKRRRGFVCFTFDDGYRDVWEHAYPLFRRHGVPFAVYVCTGMPDGTALLWWDLLEEVFRRAPEVRLRENGSFRKVRAETAARKRQEFRRAYWGLRALPEPERRDEIRRLCEANDVDPAAYCREVAMTWDMIAELSASGLAGVEAHTITHPELSLLAASDVREEADRSRAIIAERTGRVPRHFAYPYGNGAAAGPREFEIIRDLGFATATTTRKGVLFPDHAKHLHALPRVSLNGGYQAGRYVKLFLSGAPFALSNRFRRLNVD